MKKAAKIISINLLIFGCLLFLVQIGSIAAMHVLNLTESDSSKAHLPNYEGIDWAAAHFEELDRLESTFEAYLGWRQAPFAGETINIDERGLRHTVASEQSAPDHTVAFFGGSTMWGMGSDDAGTIASEFAKLSPNAEVINYGNIGYVAHQSLNLFFEEYSKGARPEVVIFYDGVNEPLHKCRSADDPFGHARENQLRRLADVNKVNEPGLSLLALPVVDLYRRLEQMMAWRFGGGADFYDCDDNTEKTAQIARVLLSDWTAVKTVVEGYGGTFIGILQPNAFISESKTDHLNLSEALGEQYRSVYPKVVELIDQEFPHLKDSFLDFRATLDRDEYIYIDWCHLTGYGNQIVAENIKKEMDVLIN
jgi:hypothetical protein